MVDVCEKSHSLCSHCHVFTAQALRTVTLKTFQLSKLQAIHTHVNLRKLTKLCVWWFVLWQVLQLLAWKL